MDVVGIRHNVAVFAIHLATSCRILPFLPPITRNVKLPRTANRREFGIRAEGTPNTTSQSGKNGNVAYGGQH